MKTLIAVTLSILALAGCSDKNANLRGQFIAGCSQGGVSKSGCACTFDKLEEKYSPAELKAMNDPGKPVPDQVMNDVMGFAMICRES